MAADLRRLANSVSYWEHEARRSKREVADLKLHLRDRDRHIANLEAELRPHLVNAEPGGTQEELL
jgi:hypothetical protein